MNDQKLEFYVKDDPLRDFTNLQINENEKFVIDIDHFDEESPEVFSDLLFVTTC